MEKEPAVEENSFAMEEYSSSVGMCKRNMTPEEEEKELNMKKMNMVRR